MIDPEDVDLVRVTDDPLEVLAVVEAGAALQWNVGGSTGG